MIVEVRSYRIKLAMPLLDSYDVILCEASPGCVFDIN